MKFVISFDVDNASFGIDDPAARNEEIYFILKEIVYKLEHGGGVVRDSNGNKIGEFGFCE